MIRPPRLNYSQILHDQTSTFFKKSQYDQVQQSNKMYINNSIGNDFQMIKQSVEGSQKYSMNFYNLKMSEDFKQEDLYEKLKQEIKKECLIVILIQIFHTCQKNLIQSEYDQVIWKSLQIIFQKIQNDLEKMKMKNNPQNIHVDYEKEGLFYEEIVRKICENIKIPHQPEHKSLNNSNNQPLIFLESFKNDQSDWKLQQFNSKKSLESMKFCLSCSQKDEKRKISSLKSARLEKLTRFREKKLQRKQISHYPKRQNVAQKRIRIKGQFISQENQKILEQMLGQQIKNFPTKLLQQKMNIHECVNQHGYSYVDPKEIIKKVEKIKNLYQKNEKITKSIFKNLRCRKNIFKIIKNEDELKNNFNSQN